MFSEILKHFNMSSDIGTALKSIWVSLAKTQRLLTPEKGMFVCLRERDRYKDRDRETDSASEDVGSCQHYPGIEVY